MKKNKKIIAIVLFDIAAIALIGWYFVQPKYIKIGELTQEIQTKEEDLANKKQTAEDIQLLKKNYSEISEENINKVARVLPGGENIISLLPEIEAIISQNGLTADSINFNRFLDDKKSTDKKISPFARGDANLLEIRIAAGGRYESFKNFLKSIERDERLTDVANIEFKIDRSKNDGLSAEDNSNFSFILVLYTYWME